MSEVTKKSDTSSSQMRLLGGTPHIYHLEKVVPSLQVQVPSVAASLPPSQPLLLLESAVSTPSTTK